MDGSVVGLSEVLSLVSQTFGDALPSVLAFVMGGYAVLLIVRSLRGAVR